MKKIIKKFVNLFKSKNYIPIYNIVNDNNLLKDKVAFITGGSGGIGLSIAKSFIKAGCKVILSGTNEKKLASNCGKLGDTSNYIVLNMNDIELFDKKISEAVNIYGKIDILVNSHGVHTERSNADFMNFTEEEYDNVMNINLKGTYFFNQVMSKYFVNNKIKGHILFISSSTSYEPSWSPYRLSKIALNGLVSGMAQKLIKYGVVVNGISPGSTATALLNFEEGDSIYTDQNSNGRYVMPEEVANIALLLASDAGNMMVGEIICISGGRGRIEIQ